MVNFMEKMQEKDYYKRKIVDMVDEIENSEILSLIYGFAKSGYAEEKAGRE